MNLNQNETHTVDDSDIDEAIKIILTSTGFQCDDPEAISLIKAALKKKLEIIIANAHFYTGIQDGEAGDVLRLSQLKSALNEEGIKIDRPDFIIEQTQSKMSTRRSKSGK